MSAIRAKLVFGVMGLNECIHAVFFALHGEGDKGTNICKVMRVVS